MSSFINQFQLKTEKNWSKFPEYIYMNIIKKNVIIEKLSRYTCGNNQDSKTIQCNKQIAKFNNISACKQLWSKYSKSNNIQHTQKNA